MNSAAENILSNIDLTQFKGKFDTPFIKIKGSSIKQDQGNLQQSVVSAVEPNNNQISIQSNRVSEIVVGDAEMPCLPKKKSQTLVSILDILRNPSVLGTDQACLAKFQIRSSSGDIEDIQANRKVQV